MKNIAFQEGDSKSIEKLIKTNMEEPIKHYEHDLLKIRTGRASTTLIDDIRVECYGTQVLPLREVATLAAPDGRLLTIQAWDKTIIGDIEKAILKSDLGVTPINDGNLIRIQLPQMSSARREELVKQMNKKTEECKVSVRNIRKEIHNEIRDANKKHIISEDFAMRLTELLQKITDNFIERIDKIHDKKAHEVREI